MKNRFHLLSIVLTVILAAAITGCDDQMQGPRDAVLDAVVQPPTEPVTPPKPVVRHQNPWRSRRPFRQARSSLWNPDRSPHLPLDGSCRSILT